MTVGLAIYSQLKRTVENYRYNFVNYQKTESIKLLHRFRH